MVRSGIRSSSEVLSGRRLATPFAARSWHSASDFRTSSRAATVQIAPAVGSRMWCRPGYEMMDISRLSIERPPNGRGFGI